MNKTLRQAADSTGTKEPFPAIPDLRAAALQYLRQAMWGSPACLLHPSSAARLRALSAVRKHTSNAEFLSLYELAPSDVPAHDQYELALAMMAKGISSVSPALIAQAQACLQGLTGLLAAAQTFSTCLLPVARSHTLCCLMLLSSCRMRLKPLQSRMRLELLVDRLLRGSRCLCAEDVQVERAVCTLLLGKTAEAVRMLQGTRKHGSMGVVHFLAEYGRSWPEQVEGACAFGEQWVHRVLQPTLPSSNASRSGFDLHEWAQLSQVCSKVVTDVGQESTQTKHPLYFLSAADEKQFQS